MACLESTEQDWRPDNRAQRPDSPWTCPSSPAQHGMALSSSEGDVAGGHGGPACRLSPGCGPQPTAQRGPQGSLGSSPLPPEAGCLVLNPYGSGQDLQNADLRVPWGTPACLPALPSETRLSGVV